MIKAAYFWGGGGPGLRLLCPERKTGSGGRRRHFEIVFGLLEVQMLSERALAITIGLATSI
eukprot:7958255-Heterocapsa_arctica.AAC.1